MSAFLNAIYNIDNINIDPRLKPAFVKMLKLYHENDKEWEVSKTINVKKFFEDYLYTNVNKNKSKLKIIFTDKNKPSLDKTKAMFLVDENKLLVYPPNSDYDRRDILEKWGSEEDYQVVLLSHEFTHYLTLFGIITTDYNKNMETFKKTKGASFSTPSYLQVPAFFEPLTEMLSKKMIGKDYFHYYPEQVKTMQFMNTVYGIKDFSGFLKRTHTQYTENMPIMPFMNYIQNHHKRFRVRGGVSTTKNREYLFDSTLELLDVYHAKFDFYKKTMPTKKILDDVFEIFDNLPYKHSLTESHEGIAELKQKADAINKSYNLLLEKAGSEILGRNNIEDTNKAQKSITKLIRRYIELKDNLGLEKQTKTDNIIKANFGDNILMFAKKDDKFLFSDYGFRVQHNISPFFILGNLTDNSQTETNIRHTSANYTFDVKKQQNENFKATIAKFWASNELLENGKYKQLSVSNETPYEFNVKDNILTVYGKNKTQSFDLANNTKQQEMGGFEKTLSSLIKKLKHDQEFNKNFNQKREGALVVKPNYDLTIQR